MSESVSPQIAIAPEHFTTIRAIVWFDVSMREHVSLEIGSLIKTATTTWALVRRIVHVKYPMDGKGSRLAEPLATLCTLEWLLF